ncbi:hypothetical protein [Rhizorhabdus argentea]|uniref:hypothetical protein n=1 Tax=Rhizorhabdus argentea TaxID=1387174 RepID=UPI0030EC4006
MVDTSENRRVPTWGKLLVTVVTIGFLALQMWGLLNPAGIMSRYTFMEGFTEFNKMMLADPLLTAGLLDLLFLELVFLVILLNGIPRGPAYPFIFAAFVLAMIVYPALGGLAFLILYWRRLGQFRP